MKQFRASPRLWTGLLFALIFLAAGPARAGCTSPTGAENNIIYNQDFHTYQFCNGTTWMSMAGGGAGSGPMSLISTQTASASASLQFTNLPTSYNTLFLNCAGLVVSTASTTPLVQIGEGAGPTWETAAHYTSVDFWYGTTASGGLADANGGTTGTDLSSMGGGTYSTTQPMSIKMYIDNVASSTKYKIATNTNGSFDGSGAFWLNTAVVYWNNDTNPVTALRLTLSAGTITSGTCSLYGMN